MQKQAKKSLVMAAPEQCFWMCNGAIIKNLKELKDAMKSIDNNTFAYHANRKKNDFSKWIAEVLRDPELAKKIAKDKTQKAVLKNIEGHLKKNYAL